jgi:uncharacterized protein involved in oxidation of intracellular sulfur
VKLALVLHSTEPETVWNAFRPGVFALKQGDTVKACLLANGVEAESLPSDKFAVEDQMQSFVEAGGHILACGTCLKTRQSQDTDFCPISTMADFYDIVRESDRVLTFQQFADGANRASRPAGLAWVTQRRQPRPGRVLAQRSSRVRPRFTSTQSPPRDIIRPLSLPRCLRRPTKLSCMLRRLRTLLRFKL